MKKTLLLFLLFVVFVFTGFSQITLESGSNLIVSSSTSVIAANGIVNNGGSIDIASTAVIENQGDLENNVSGLITATSTGTFKFNGSVAQEITGNHDAEFYGNVEIDNSNGVSITSADQTINGTLEFTNGLLTLNTFNLALVNDATTPETGKYVQTNSTGYVTRNVPADASDVVFPVGNSAYNPITLQNSATATADDYSVRVLDVEPASGSTNHMVDRSWEVAEGTPGASELTVTAQWNSTEELTGFDRDNAAIGLTSDAGSTYEWAGTDAATGSDPYRLAGSTFTGVGTFAVGDYFYAGKQLDLVFFLSGAYNGSAMDNDLYTAALIPTTDPYSLGTTVTSVPSNAIDWVKVELRSNADHADVDYSFAFFVDASGNLLNTDGTTGGKITGAVLQNYYIAVTHRNHLGVVSSAVVDLSATSPTYDFTTALSSAWDDASVTTNDAMKNISGVFCLWEGDANSDGEVQYEGGNPDRISVLSAVGVSTPSNIITNTYSDNDVNMDTEVQYEGGNPDRITILSVVGVSTPSQIFYEHIPE